MRTPRKLKKKVKKSLESANKGKVKVTLIDNANGIQRYQYKLTNKDK